MNRDPRAPRTVRDDRALAKACIQALGSYRTAVAKGRVTTELAARARRALIHLGGDPFRVTASMKHYNHERYGPFLGVSDEGSATGAIREAAFESPKVRALTRRGAPPPLLTGVAIDAERLGGVGEVAVGPEEYADIWLGAVDRLLVTTNIGTRVNLRVYRSEPRVPIGTASSKALAEARAALSAAFEPFVATPDGDPRPLTVYIDFGTARLSRAQKTKILRHLMRFVRSGEAAGKHRAPSGQGLGLAVEIQAGLRGKKEAMAAIDMAAKTGIETVILDGTTPRRAGALVSRGGILDYFAPGIVGPLQRYAEKKKVRLRAASVPDTDTIARSIWTGLTTARSMGANLGKYGCFPLNRREIDHVVSQVQRWFSDWSAAPVFFVDQGLLNDRSIDVESDLCRGIEAWLKTVAAHGVRVVLIDTVDKSSGRPLLKKSSTDRQGYLTLGNVDRVEAFARPLKIKVLWAGGLGLRDVFAMGQRGVFGIYVTTAAATMIAVGGSYRRDPALAGVKEPSKDAVLRTKIVLEAGFLASRLEGEVSERIIGSAHEVLAAAEAKDAARAKKAGDALASLCVDGWRTYWKE